MADTLADSMRYLESIRKKTDHILVGFSGGKDSVVVMDLASRVFPKVSAFFMYFVPGLQVDSDRLSILKKRYKIKDLIELPHPVLLQGLANGIYTKKQHADVPEIDDDRDIYDMAKAISGCKAAVFGWKYADNLKTHVRMINNGEERGYFSPIKNWNKADVLAYLEYRGIPKPPTSGCISGGNSLRTREILWFYDEHPEDYERIKKWFPMVEALVKRREWYGIPAVKGKKQGKTEEEIFGKGKKKR